MKKKLVSFGMSCLFAMTALTAVSCGGTNVTPSAPSNDLPSTEIEEGEPYVSSLEVINLPNKTSYKEGEIFDGTGMTLKATWSHKDEETGENITEDLSMFDVQYSKEPLEGGTTFVEVFYENQSVKININVVGINVTALSIYTYPNMLTFTTSDKFTLDGLVLHAVLEGGEKMIIEKGYSVTIGGKDVTEEVLGEGKLFAAGTYEVIISYKGKSASFEINVVDGVSRKIEAEKILGSAFYPAIDQNDKNYIELNEFTAEWEKSNSKSHIMQNSGEPASGNAYFGELNKVGKGFTIHIYSEVATKAVFSMRASSGVIAESAPNDGWTPVKMKDIQLNQLVKVVANNNNLSIGDDVILPGGKLEDVGGNNSLLWVNWQSVDFGEIDLKQGDNQIYLEVTNLIKHGSNTGSGAINIDYFDFIVK